MTATALLLLVLPVLQSPSVSPLTPGTRVRVTVREPIDGRHTVIGPLRTFDSQMLTLTTEGSANQVSLSRSGITMIEISRGRRSQAGRGLLLGAVLGLAVVALKDVGCNGPDCNNDTSAAFIGGAVAGGALVGAGVGALMRSERWESLPWAAGPARRSSVPLPTRPLAVGLSVSF